MTNALALQHNETEFIHEMYKTYTLSFGTVSVSVVVSHIRNSVAGDVSVLTRLDYGNATFAGISSSLIQRLLSVMKSAARLLFSSSRYDQVAPLLRQLHCLQAAERIDFKLVFIGVGMEQHLADELSQLADFEAQRRLLSLSHHRR